MAGRRGSSLVEAVTTMSVLAVLMVAGATTIGLLLRSEGRGAESLAISHALDQLSHRFRRDVHAALRAELAGKQRPEDAVRLRQPDGRWVLYRDTLEGVIREESAAGAAKRPVRRERFRLGNSRVRFRLSEDGQWVSLVWTRPATPSRRRAAETGLSRESVGRGMEITAAVRLDYRFQGLE